MIYGEETIKQKKMKIKQIKTEDLVLDTFGGSGTTLVTAESLGRKARVMELDPHYCDVILSRWETLTGDTARRV